MENKHTYPMPHSMPLLGYAGLLPFVGLPLLMLLGFTNIASLQAALNAYAFGIISFLCGTWWRANLQSKDTTEFFQPALVLSNALFLIAFFAFLLLPTQWPLISAVLLVGIFWVEHYTPLVGQFPLNYKRMRRALSIIASIGLLSSYIIAGV